jgi:hypothetical protein
VFQGEVIGRTQLDMLSGALKRFAEERARYDPAQFVDVEYDDFVGDPLGTVRGIYRAFDLPWTSDVADRVGAIDAESRQGPRRPAHRYSLADYGLTDERVLSRF